VKVRVKGEKGDAGLAGVTGARGATGAAGAAGSDGAAGAKGRDGDAGAAGLNGAPGVDGAAGAPGPKGDQGNTGPAGPAGPVGPAGPATPDARFGIDFSPAVAGGGACTLGEVGLTAARVAPGTPANGQLLSIAQNTALFALLGTDFGGNGLSTFALPDLRDAAPDELTYWICTEGIFPSRL